jgi:hypothetical protein
MKKVINKINVKNIIDNTNANKKDSNFDLMLLALKKNENHIIRQRTSDRYAKKGTFSNNKGYSKVFHNSEGKFTSFKDLFHTLENAS